MQNSEPKSFWLNLFGCCTRSEGLDKSVVNIGEIMNKVKETFYGDLIQERFILPEEKGKVTFTKEGIISFIKRMHSLSGYTIKFDQKGLKLSTLDSSELNNEFMVVRCEFIKPKSDFGGKVQSVKQLADAMNVPEQRTKWDKNLKEFAVLETLGEGVSILKSVTTKQLGMIDEREIIDKRIEIFDSAENVFYQYSSSVPDEIYPPAPNPIRCKDYFGTMMIREDEENYYIDSINQIDIKMSIPQSLIIMSFPMKMKDYFENLTKFFNQ